MDAIVLASSSPQRAAILKALGIPFIAVRPDCREYMPKRGDPAAVAMANAEKKLISVMGILQGRGAGSCVLSADTVVGKGGEIFGKPESRAEAFSMLKALSGGTCEIVTALCLFGNRTRSVSARASRTKVSLAELSCRQIERYLDAGEWRGAAGGCRIQGLASCFVSNVEGSVSGAAGLPAHLLYELLLEHVCGFIV